MVGPTLVQCCCGRISDAQRDTCRSGHRGDGHWKSEGRWDWCNPCSSPALIRLPEQLGHELSPRGSLPGERRGSRRHRFWRRRCFLLERRRRAVGPMRRRSRPRGPLSGLQQAGRHIASDKRRKRRPDASKRQVSELRYHRRGGSRVRDRRCRRGGCRGRDVSHTRALCGLLWSCFLREKRHNRQPPRAPALGHPRGTNRTHVEHFLLLHDRGLASRSARERTGQPNRTRAAWERSRHDAQGRRPREWPVATIGVRRGRKECLQSPIDI